MFNRLLVANRGEIAVRVIRAANELGIRTVAIYSPVDKQALHVKLADEAFPINDSTNFTAYLDIEQLIRLSLEKDIDAIHPGYGFLSENKQFVERITEEGMTFIGHPAEVIGLFGDKVQSRKQAIKSGLTVPEGSEITSTVKEGLMEAKKIGFPVIVKAVYGGGGMGINIVRTEEEFPKAFQNAQAQAESAFGRKEVFIENFLERPKHIEFQIIADTFGKVVHLGERECSIQRRNQKLLEEAPSPAITKDTRKEIGNLVCQFAKDVGYVNAGTVEFLFEDETLYFNEVNPRIQVEHPVTEMITGVDLVKEQIRIAAGEELSFKQKDIEIRGHSIELRINAENPLENFRPSPGLIKKFVRPGGAQVRFDTGIYEGFTIPSCYDSLIGKLIVNAKTRQEAINKSLNALNEMRLLGFPTNIPFFKTLLHNKEFRSGNTSIRFIEENQLLEHVRLNIYKQVCALFAAGIKKNELQLPKESEQWRMKSKLQAVGRD
jgi:acetyl-CoA carboxylase biotin carboxylase subunit